MGYRFFQDYLIVIILVVLSLSGCKAPLGLSASATEMGPPATEQAPVKTLPVQEQVELVTELLQTNANCQPPCWWGIVPGETRWETVQDFFLSLGRRIFTTTQEGYRVPFYEPEFRISVQLFFALDSNGVIRMIHAEPRMWAEDDPEMIYGGAYYAKVMNRWILTNMLTEFGKPDEIWVRSYETTLINSSPLYYYDEYYLILYYLDAGVAISYYGRSSKKDDTVYICPRDDALNLSLDLWSPEEHLSSLDVFSSTWWFPKKFSDNFRNHVSKQYRSLEEAAGIDIDAFYETFREKDTQECLKTPAEMWK